MAITKLNSLAIPPNTIVESDLSYPLTNFSSTGIDDNATSTAVTINASENVGIGVVPDSFNTVDGALQVGTRNTLTSFSNDIGIGYNHYYSSGWKYANTDVAARFSSTSAIPFLWQYAASGSADGAITWSEAMRIDSSGNVGIGTSSPANKLDVNGILQSSSVGNYLQLQQSSTDGYINMTGSGGLNFRMGSGFDTRMTIDSSGNVGIGTTATANTRVYVRTALATDVAYLADNSTNSGFKVKFNSGSTAILNDFNAPLIFGTNDTERMRIDASGNVMIKNTTGASFTLNAATDLSIGSGIGNAGMTIYSGVLNQGAISFADGTTGDQQYRGYIVYTHSTDVMQIGTAGTEAMRIDSGGHVLIGRSSTGASAADYGMNLYSSGIMYLFANAAGNDDIFRGHNSAGTNTSAIEADGDYIDLSDSRFKQNIVDAPSVINTIKSMPVRSFDWKDRSYGQTYGFVAQELNGICPEVVKVPESEEDVWGVRNSKVVPMLVKAVQEQQAMIEELKAEVAALKGA